MVSVAYTCTFLFRKTTKIPKETFLSVNTERQNPWNEGMEETFFPDSLSNELSILQGEIETPGWEMQSRFVSALKEFRVHFR